MNNCLYIFLDEGGNFDFSPSGTRYFTLTAASVFRPFTLLQEMADYRYDLLEFGLDKQHLHCCEDNRHVRERVFSIISNHLDDIRLDTLIVEKRKTNPTIQPEKRFYPKMMGYVLRYAFNAARNNGKAIDSVMVVTDQIPIKKKRRAIEKAIKTTLGAMLPADFSYSVYHHDSKAHAMLQVTDYCNWALFRKWESGDSQYYDLIKPAIKSEFDIFRTGTTHFY